ncbi:MAG: ABC transporter permease [Bacillota bacterium]
MRYVKLYGAFLGHHLKIYLEYRLNFVISALGVVGWQVAGLAAVWVVLSQVNDLGGWSAAEVFLIYGLITLAMGISRTFYFNLFFLGQGYIRPGTFDRLLVRPVNPLFHLLADRFSPEGIGDLVVGVALVTHAFGALGIPWSLPNLLYLLAVALGGSVIILAINLFTATFAFWIVVATPLTLAVNHFTQIARYPLPIYRKPLQLVMTWLLPYGLISFYPAEFLLGRAVGPMAFAYLPMGLLLFAGAYRFWLFGLRHYAGTGS